jgi:hypothetical protein
MTNTTATHKVGDKVSVDDPKFPGIWEIIQVLKVNVRLKHTTTGALLRAPMSMLTEPTEVPLGQPAVKMYNLGAVIRIADGTKYAGIYTVIKDDGGDRVNLAKLGGGDGGRYLRSPRRGLQEVDMTDVLDLLK